MMIYPKLNNDEADVIFTAWYKELVNKLIETYHG